MCREHGDRKASQFIKSRESGVSGALWPVDVRRHVATNWFAQQRRSFAMKELEWLYVQRCVIQCFHFFRPLLLLALLGGSIILATFVLQYWMILLTLAVIWSILIILATRFLVDGLYSIILSTLHRYRNFMRHRSRFLTATPQFPETPMPAAPLIRVLETIDLSTMDVEHFIADMPQTQTYVHTPLPQDSERNVSQDVSLL